MKPKAFILDVDGVMTTGQFFYTSDGKAMKVFGPDDADGLQLVKDALKVHFISADKKGFEISKKRIHDDMKYPLDLVPVVGRIAWIEKHFDCKDVIFMGDGIFDHYVMRKTGYAIAPANAHEFAKKAANYVTQRVGGQGAVAEACLHILEKFFQPYDMNAAEEPVYS
jgi:3-deoxy-D-manno-octulosonate 8-phosphate phosphatase (KDO 8-P phosphatase)